MSDIFFTLSVIEKIVGYILLIAIIAIFAIRAKHGKLHVGTRKDTKDAV